MQSASRFIRVIPATSAETSRIRATWPSPMIVAPEIPAPAVVGLQALDHDLVLADQRIDEERRLDAVGFQHDHDSPW
jgi:hypothetical protein